MEANKEIIEFIKEQITEAKIELYLTEVIMESIKEYEKHRPVYLKNEWSYEDIGRALAKIMIVKVEPPMSALGKKEFARLNSLHKHIVSNNEVAVCDNPHCIDGIVDEIYGEKVYCSVCQSQTDC